MAACDELRTSDLSAFFPLADMRKNVSFPMISGAMICALIGLVSCTNTKPSGKTESKTMIMTPDQDAYVRKYLNGTGKIRHLVFREPLLENPEATRIIANGPSLGAWRLAAEYLESKVSPGVVFERRVGVPAPYVGYPVAGTSGRPVNFPPGVAYVVIFKTKLQKRPNSTVVDSAIGVGIYGDSEVIGVHSATLENPAPGDVPCHDVCTTSEAAFQSIRGRLDLIIRNIQKGS